jgi:cobalt-zinc-cadmium efflux system outer membrane protein
MRRSIAALVVLSGCAVPEDAGFEDVRRLVGERTPHRIHWRRGSAEDEEARRAVEDLLKGELGVEAAVQVALLNNPELQADYEDLGMAQADLVQAGMLRNPRFLAAARFPTGSDGGTAWEMEIVQDFLDLLMFPARKKLGELEFERARLEVADHVIETAARTREAWYEAVAARQTAEVRKAIAEAAEASAEMAQRLRAAGNVSELGEVKERLLCERAKADWEEAEAEASAARERLTVLLGLWGEEAAWTPPSRLPEVPTADGSLEKLESLAIARRLDLTAALRERDLSEGRLELVKAFRWIGSLELGAGAERESDREWSVGPVLELELPLFDRQQARLAALRSELRRREAANRDLAIRIRSEVRAARDRLVSARRLFEHQRDTVIPLRERAVALLQKEFNFMLTGVTDVLLAKQEEYDAWAQAVERAKDYWTARAELERAVGGKLPENSR